jgi:hypothetical protein
MGTEIRRVPPGFQHPLDGEGGHIPGAHCEPLYRAGESQCTCYQLYENVSEGTPISPIFDSKAALVAWLRERGYPEGTISMLESWGHAPSFVVRL